MPEIGEIKRAWEIGRKGHRLCIFRACPDCGKEQWVEMYKGQPKSVRCKPCALKPPNHPSWKGGRNETQYGYIQIKLQPDDFFYPMADSRGYVMEHRLVMAKALNRCLLPWEVVHHKGVKYPEGSIENKQDNRYPENLELLPLMKRHLPSMRIRAELNKRDKLIKELQARVTLLEAEIVRLNEPIIAVRTR